MRQNRRFEYRRVTQNYPILPRIGCMCVDPNYHHHPIWLILSLLLFSLSLLLLSLLSLLSCYHHYPTTIILYDRYCPHLCPLPNRALLLIFRYLSFILSLSHMILIVIPYDHYDYPILSLSLSYCSFLPTFTPPKKCQLTLPPPRKVPPTLWQSPLLQPVVQGPARTKMFWPTKMVGEWWYNGEYSH